MKINYIGPNLYGSRKQKVAFASNKDDKKSEKNAKKPKENITPMFAKQFMGDLIRNKTRVKLARDYVENYKEYVKGLSLIDISNPLLLNKYGSTKEKVDSIISEKFKHISSDDIKLELAVDSNRRVKQIIITTKDKNEYETSEQTYYFDQDTMRLMKKEDKYFPLSEDDPFTSIVEYYNYDNDENKIVFSNTLNKYKDGTYDVEQSSYDIDKGFCLKTILVAYDKSGKLDKKMSTTFYADCADKMCFADHLSNRYEWYPRTNKDSK